MGYALIEEEKLDMLFTELREQRALLVNLQPAKPEPDPYEHWTAEMIAKASGLHPETIKQKRRNLKVPAVKRHPVTIEYRHIAKLKLKNFNPK